MKFPNPAPEPAPGGKSITPLHEDYYASFLILTFPVAGRVGEAHPDNAVREQGRPAFVVAAEVRGHRGGREDGEGPQRHLHRDERQGRQQRLRRPRSLGQVGSTM